MICPLCNGKLKVVDTRNVKCDNSIIRRKRCIDCSALFYTEENEVDYDDIRHKWLKTVNDGKMKRR